LGPDRRDSALEGTFQFLLSESDFQKATNKLLDDTDNEYKEALRKHVRLNKKNIGFNFKSF
jgi:hypothetical protein